MTKTPKLQIEPEILIEKEALALGFSQVGFTHADAIDGAGDFLESFVNQGRHASMEWMKERLFHRQHPRNLWPDTRGIVALGMNYGPDIDPRAILDHPDRAGISVYAKGKDYHDIVKKRLKALARFMVDQFQCELKVFVDTAPVMEKPLSAAAGLGWQGKHTNMVSRSFGSWLFLGVIYTNMNFAANQPHRDHCGGCSACLDACPTNAFPEPYQIDARRCISYLTIEHKGPIAEEFRPLMGNRIYGCDDCLAACPWNKFAQTASEAAFYARAELMGPKLQDLLLLDDATFRQIFSGSPIKRIGRNRFVRNCLYAAGNSGDRALLPIIQQLLLDEDPVVQDAANWAAQQLDIL